jgi:glutathione peroxidase-family protein
MIITHHFKYKYLNYIIVTFLLLEYTGILGHNCQSLYQDITSTLNINAYKNDVRILFSSSCLLECACLIYVFCVCLRMVLSNTYCVVWLLCLSSCCKFLWIVLFYCPFRILWPLFWYKYLNYIIVTFLLLEYTGILGHNCQSLYQDITSTLNINAREYRRGNQKKTIQRNWQHRLHKTQDQNKGQRIRRNLN